MRLDSVHLLLLPLLLSTAAEYCYHCDCHYCLYNENGFHHPAPSSLFVSSIASLSIILLFQLLLIEREPS